MRPARALRKPSEATASVRAGKLGRSPRARWTLATVPLQRKFLMRWANVGSSCDGSRRWKKVRLGSTPETTALAGISSPLARTRPLTAPSLTRMWRAEASVREGCGTDGMGVGSGAQEEDGGRACGPRAERGAENAACGDDGAKK